jgi:tubulin--tyrosine ligase
MSKSVRAIVEYEDEYVQPIIVDALQSQLGEHCELADDMEEISRDRVLQIRAYEAIDFEHGMSNPETLMNAYVIRKALIRKHYLSNIIHHWTAKNPESCLRKNFMPAEDFELDYAEFLDEALVETFDLRASCEQNATLEPEQRKWWILKPSMSDRGQGIRLFSTEEELQAIFDKWEEQNPDDDDDEENDDDDDAAAERARRSSSPDIRDDEDTQKSGDYIVTSHLRHFVAQPYIHPPLLISDAPFSDRKFHIRTYVIAAGALRVYVYSHMLALFASETYSPPWSSDAGNSSAEGSDLLQRMRNVHLTNTCVQRSGNNHHIDENNVFLLSKLPLSTSAHDSIQKQIQDTTSELFRAAAASPTDFQALPNAFEVFGVDFIVDEANNVWLLEVNAFPDFAQTGEELKNLVVKGLWKEIADVIIAPHFGINTKTAETNSGEGRLTEVLDLNMGRR